MIAIVAAIKAVILPRLPIKNKEVEANSKRGEHLIIKKTPAVTKVAAWINADTGVGPSIASGNQVCNPIWADFATEPINKKIQIKVKIETLKKNNISLKKGTKTKITEKSVFLKK